MNKKKFLGYVRVASVKQGEASASLQQQRDVISKYAAQSGVEITGWFEEVGPAVRRGRPKFSAMLQLLRQKRANGVIAQRPDRLTRNLGEWAELVSLEKRGIEVRYCEGKSLSHELGDLPGPARGGESLEPGHL